MRGKGFVVMQLFVSRRGHMVAWIMLWSCGHCVAAVWSSRRCGVFIMSLWCCVRRFVVSDNGCISSYTFVVLWLSRGCVVALWSFMVVHGCGCGRSSQLWSGIIGRCGWLLLGRGDMAVAIVVCLVVVVC